MSKHPFNWLVHFALCAGAVGFGWATWFVVLFVAVMVEWEQRSQTWYAPLSDSQYWFRKATPDLVADVLGIAVGLSIHSDLTFIWDNLWI